MREIPSLYWSLCEVRLMYYLLRKLHAAICWTLMLTHFPSTRKVAYSFENSFRSSCDVCITTRIPLIGAHLVLLIGVAEAE